MARLSLSLLGAVEVSLDNAAVTAFESDKVRALLIYLAVEAHQSHRREFLVGLLWPESPEAAARRSLNQALYNLRQSIGDQAAIPPYLHTRREALQFNTASDHSLDVVTFSTLLDACDTHRHQRIETCTACAEHLQQAVGLYRGSFLEQFSLADSAAFEEWMLLKRESLHRRALLALAQLAAHYEQRGEYLAARQYATRQLELDAWQEEAHRQLMRVLVLAGERSAALVQYETCRRVLADQLGVEPCEETLALYRQIERGELQPERVTGGAIRIDNLPQALTPFVGRVHEVAELARLVADPACRLLTLVGPGGIGKTRLAAHLAAQQRAAFTDGVALVPLAAITSAGLLVPAIGDALGFAFYGPADPTMQLVNYLRQKQILLVLDNVEQLLEELALLPHLLQQAPYVKLLVTSREPLTLPGEWVFEVAGLALHVGDHTHESDAAALFVQRARRAQVGFALNETQRGEVARICRLVGGMPLAIELAAAWVRTLSCAEIAQEIQRNLDFLAGSRRELEARHRSVRAVFDQSWQALSAEEQQVLRCLGVFRGGFTRAAAEQVAGATLGVLSTLVVKSLVHRSYEGRYDLHELVRQYVEEQLAQDPVKQAATYARFSRYYVDWLLRQEAPLFSVEQRATLDMIAGEMGNVRAALLWAATDQQWASLDKALDMLLWFYELRTRSQEAVAMLEQWLAALRQVDPQVVALADYQVALGHTLGVLSGFFMPSGQLGRARAMSEESIGLLHGHHTPHALADALFYAGVLRMVIGEYAECEQYMLESLDLERGLGRDMRVTRCYYFLGYMALPWGHLAEARMYVSEALRRLKATGETIVTIRCQVLLTTIMNVQGELVEAEHLARATLAISRTVNDSWSQARMLTELGVLALKQGQPMEARRQLRDGIAVLRELGQWWPLAQALNQLGKATSVLGDDTEAQRCFLEGFKTAMTVQSLPVALDALAGMAAVRVRAGTTEAALELLTQILGHPLSSQETRARAEQLRAELERQLSPEQIEAAQVRAQAKSFETVVQEMLRAE